MPTDPTSTATVLLIPAEGDPLGLLAEGPCGARPPFAWRNRTGAWYPTAVWPARKALVLAWKGQSLGVWWLGRLAALDVCQDHGHHYDVNVAWLLRAEVADALRGRPPGDRLLAKLGTVVILDAKGGAE